MSRRSQAGARWRVAVAATMLAATMVVGAGCAGSSTAGTTAPDSSGAATSQQSNEAEGGLDAYIRSRVGRTPKEISDQQAQTVMDATVKCMEGTGFSSADIDPLVKSSEKSDEVAMGTGAGSATSWAIASMKVYQETTEGTPGENPSIELQQAWVSCQTQAESENPDVTEPLYEQLNTYIDEHNSRVKADPRYLAAASDFEACHQERGYTVESLEAKKTALHEQATAIVDQVADRKLPSDEALAQIEALHTQEIETLGDVEDCEVPFNDAAAEVSDEVDLAIIEANAATFDQIFDELKASLPEPERATSSTP